MQVANLNDSASSSEAGKQGQVFLARLIERLPLSLISKEVKQTFIEDPRAVKWLAAQMSLYVSVDAVLSAPTKVTFTMQNPPYPETFTKREGLYIDHALTDLMRKQKRVPSQRFKLVRRTIQAERATNAAIHLELSSDYIFPAEDLVACLSYLHYKEISDHEHHLNTNGVFGHNFFYVRSVEGGPLHVVKMWRQTQEEVRWVLEMYPATDEQQWSAGSFVFSRN